MLLHYCFYCIYQTNMSIFWVNQKIFFKHLYLFSNFLLLFSKGVTTEYGCVGVRAAVADNIIKA